MEAAKTNLRQILAANLKERRKILGISQEKLAEITGLSWQTVNSIECQRTWASDTTLETLAAALKIETFQLLIPLEIRAVLSSDVMESFRQLVAAKKSYDETFNNIIYPMLVFPSPSK
jgi:transcriptional regulator with XRE-family HTH domain